MLIDTHAHLYWHSYETDLNEVLQRSLDAGVSTIINIGVDIETSKKALFQVTQKLSNFPGLTTYSTIGIHPHEVYNYIANPDILIQQDLAELEKLYKENSNRIVGVGECGLDFFLEGNPDFEPSTMSLLQVKDLQKKLFQAHINLAKKLNLPLIVHCRDDRSKNPENSECWDEVLNLIDDLPTILHCYSGLLQTTQKALQKENILISFAANITYPKNEYLREAIKIIPLEKIILETDCPFLAPQSKRGQRNEPASVKEIAELVAQIKEIPVEKVEKQTTENAKNIFKI